MNISPKNMKNKPECSNKSSQTDIDLSVTVLKQDMEQHIMCTEIKNNQFLSERFNHVIQ